MKTELRLIESCNENRKVPLRPTNDELRSREYLTPDEVSKLSDAARQGRWGLRDATLIMVAYRHGLRAGMPYNPANQAGRKAAVDETGSSANPILTGTVSEAALSSPEALSESFFRFRCCSLPATETSDD